MVPHSVHRRGQVPAGIDQGPVQIEDNQLLGIRIHASKRQVAQRHEDST